MTKEAENTRFRRGESANRPYGGNVSGEPFPQALYCLAVSRGFESQAALAKALGCHSPTVGAWYKGKSIPSPEAFGNLLILFNPKDEEREPLVELYAKRLAEQKASLGLKISRSSMRLSNNPIGEWIENFCQERAMTINKFSAILKIPSSGTSVRRNHGRETIELIRQNAKDRLKLSEEQVASLNELIDKEIQRRTEEGHRFQSGLMRGKKLAKEQAMLNYPTYNGQQAGEMLGISREWVRKLRNHFKFPGLFTDEHIQMIRIHLEKSKNLREKIRQARC